MASKRSREVMGDRLRGPVRKATPLRSSVESKTLRRPGMSAPPKLGSMKNFCAICQLAHSRGCGGQSAGSLASVGRAGLRFGGAQVKALRERVADFVGVGGDVGGVDQQHIAAPVRRCRPHSGRSAPARSRGATPGSSRVSVKSRSMAGGRISMEASTSVRLSGVVAEWWGCRRCRRSGRVSGCRSRRCRAARPRERRSSRRRRRAARDADRSRCGPTLRA